MAICLYVIGAFRKSKHKPDAVKIGVARDIDRRCAELQCGNHLRLKVLRTYEFPSRKAAYHAEFESHRFLAKQRIGGEWFQTYDMGHIFRATQDAAALARGIISKDKVAAYEQEDYETACIIEFNRRGL